MRHRMPLHSLAAPAVSVSEPHQQESQASGNLDSHAPARSVQIALADTSYAAELRQALLSDPTFSDCRIFSGDSERESSDSLEAVHVIDLSHLHSSSRNLRNPAKTVLFASGLVDLEQVWEAGIVSVLHSNDSLEYVKLAILAAFLRPASPCLPRSQFKEK